MCPVPNKESNMSLIEELSAALKTMPQEHHELIHRAIIEIGEMKQDPGPKRKRNRHEELLRTSSEYARTFGTISFAPGIQLAVVLEVKEQYGTEELMSSLYGKDQTLVAGCQVLQLQRIREEESNNVAHVAAMRHLGLG
jgi:hypothetical protein